MASPTEDDFFAFVQERQAIWHRRFILGKPRPWTTDPILQTYKFCNVYRELDKCTQYLLEKLKGISSREQQLLNIFFFRFFNRYGLYEELNIGLIASPADFISEQMLEAFTQRISKSERVFNDAYIICPGSTGQKHRTVLEVLSHTNAAAIIAAIDAAETPQQAFAALQIPLAGPFLACEFWTDLSYVGFFRQGWTDNDFVNIGPGAAWGLELLYGSSDKRLLHKLCSIQKEKLGSAWKEIAYKEAQTSYPYLSLTNMEGALCEFRKYWRLSHGKGKRRYYYPTSI